MSKLNLDEINYNESDFVIDLGEKKKKISPETITKDFEANIKKEKELILNRAKQEASEIINQALEEAQKIKQETFTSVELEKNEIIEKAKLEATEILENAKIQANEESNSLLEKSKDEIEQERIKTIKHAYDEGYKDGLEKIQEELEEKIADFDKFCANTQEIREKILKAANKDILDLIINISKKVLLQEIDGEKLDKIIKSTILLLEKKENVSIILSEKYAKLLYEIQNKTLADDEAEFNFENFTNYENFDIIQNPDFDDDTIIIENLKERFDASISSQLDVIIRNIYDNSQNGKLDLDEYIKEDEAE